MATDELGRDDGAVADAYEKLTDDLARALIAARDACITVPELAYAMLAALGDESVAGGVTPARDALNAAYDEVADVYK